jgi:hypothetical protein
MENTINNFQCFFIGVQVFRISIEIESSDLFLYGVSNFIITRENNSFIQ